MPGDIFGLRTNSSKIYDKQVDNTWPESANYGYLAGGESPGVFNTIYRIDFSNETVSAPEKNLPLGKSSLRAISNSNYGYFAGGYSSPPTVYRCTIDRLDFSNETVAVPPVDNQLTKARSALAAVSNSNYGYFGGGFFTPPSTRYSIIDRLDFYSETVSAPPGLAGSELTEGRNVLTAVSSSNYGYFAGGFAPPYVCTIDRIDFSSETVVGPPIHEANLTQARSNLAAVSSSNYGYFGGGGNPSAVDTIDRIDFSNETISLPGNDLTQARSQLTAVSSSNYGYFGGGSNLYAVDTIDRIDFSTETTSAPGNDLPAVRKSLAGISGGKSISAKGFKKYKTDIDGKPTSTTYGYFVGGYSFPGYDNDVDRLDYHTGSMSESGAYPSYMGSMGTVSNLNYGYFAGGEHPGGPTNTATIKRIDFSNESYTAVNNNLPSERDSIAGVSNSNYGYFAGGSPNVDSIDRMDFSNESISSAKNSLPTINSTMAVSMTPNYGYFVGGWQPTNAYSSLISKIDFFNETVSTPGNNLSEGRNTLGGVTDSNYGYFGAGQKGPPGGPFPRADLVEKMDLSNETISSPGNNLSQARRGIAATSDSNYGYFGGGAAPYITAKNTVDRIDMSSGTVSPSPGLNKSRYNIAALSN